MIKEAIILAGGLGTRLREAVPDLPKCMAPVADKPFLFYVINQLRMQGIDRFIFSLGYKHEVIEDYLCNHFPTLRYETVIEEEPLGTGGAILLACTRANQKNVLVVNGDTLFKADLHEAALFHNHNLAECTLLLKPMKNFDRYGVVELDESQLVKSFREKQFYEQGNINGGVYLLNKDKFMDEEFPAKFSFEKNYLESFFTRRRIYGIIQDEYFIDIGIPEDLNRAQTELSHPPLDLSAMDDNWTLFLDRDGVINVDKDGSYIFTPDEFVFTPGGPALFKKLAQKFPRIIIITNQRGVERGLMTEDALLEIHQYMQREVEKAGGRIDAIFYCSSLHNDHPERKPNPGMALRAKMNFPEIDFSRSIMVGNNLSDMHFGRNAGMYTVFVKTTRPYQELPHPEIDLAFDNLEDFAKAL
ncbi:MAG: HAD-IIIA family hydrolase [Sphingobacteriales bacterium]|nr:HAD-IIIA family hydrolase [Sphingobacteriales bacterium]